MRTLHARVVNGRYVIDEPSTLPEGTVVELVIADEEDDAELDEALVEEIRAGRESAKNEPLLDGDDVFAQARRALRR